MASKGYLPVAEFAKALEAAGVISDLDSITRVVIDLDPADAVKVYVERIGGPALKEVAGLLGEMMRDGRAVEPQAPRGVRYWVLVGRELLDSPAWAQTGLRRIELGAWEDRHQARWVLFEDPGASPKLEGLEVELTFGQHGFDAPRITHRTPVMRGAAQVSGQELPGFPAVDHAPGCDLMFAHKVPGECEPSAGGDA